MSKASSLLRAVERRMARRRRPGAVYVVGFTGFDDPDHVYVDGMRLTLAEWERQHPDSQLIRMVWGDDDDRNDIPLTHPIPADVLRNL